jgi:hypothetical protein
VRVSYPRADSALIRASASTVVWSDPFSRLAFTFAITPIVASSTHSSETSVAPVATARPTLIRLRLRWRTKRCA